MTWRAPTSVLFPYTTLFRSRVAEAAALGEWAALEADAAAPIAADSLYRAALDRLGDRIAPEVAWQLHAGWAGVLRGQRSEEHTSELQSLRHIVCRLLIEKNN